MPEKYQHKCDQENCPGIWESFAVNSRCPVCNKSSIIDEESSEYAQQIKSTLEKTSPLALDVQEAEAHLAVGIAGVTKIITKLEQQRLGLQTTAKEWATKAKYFNINLSKFDEFLDNMVTVHLKDGGEFAVIICPKFIEMEFENYTETCSHFSSTIRVIDAGEPLPQWVIDLGEQQQEQRRLAMSHEQSEDVSQDTNKDDTVSTPD